MHRPAVSSRGDDSSIGRDVDGVDCTGPHLGCIERDLPGDAIVAGVHTDGPAASLDAPIQPLGLAATALSDGASA